MKDYLMDRVKVDESTGCWVWQLYKMPHGYGMGTFEGQPFLAHRLSYTAFKGQIPDGMVIDHLCKNPSCVNPAHLEAVTQRENVMRGEGVGAVSSRTGCCPKGHPLSGENLLIRKNGSRGCKACDSERQRLFKEMNPNYHRDWARRKRAEGRP